jgi:hypothetical protein
MGTHRAARGFRRWHAEPLEPVGLDGKATQCAWKRTGERLSTVRDGGPLPCPGGAGRLNTDAQRLFHVLLVPERDPNPCKRLRRKYKLLYCIVLIQHGLFTLGPRAGKVFAPQSLAPRQALFAGLDADPGVRENAVLRDSKAKAWRCLARPGCKFSCCGVPAVGTRYD